ncbi:MAG TPA: putative DNA-binding domain-containing protein [Xanthomonadaceae bacterium]|nr:putative DNA-binding domain-containing protein [Xanthomonadaceae bacterium]
MTDPGDELRTRQLAFAHHVRDPGAFPPPPGVEERRLRVYRELFLASLGGLLAGNFPVIRRTLPDAGWDALVRAFYTGHRCSTPLFTEVAGEFVGWLATRDPGATGDPPWLAELAHYEWVELALQIQEDEPAHGGSHFSGDPVTESGHRQGGADKIALSPLARPLAYAWPVHRISPDQQPVEAPATPTLLLVRRDDAGDVHFSELSPPVFRLLQLLDDGSGAHTADAVLETLAAEAGETGNVDFQRAGRAMLKRLQDEGTVIRVLC